MADVVNAATEFAATTASSTTIADESVNNYHNDDEKLRKLLKPAPTNEDIYRILQRYYYHGPDAESDIHIVQQLDSYDDCNYQVTIRNEMYLCKVTNGLESRDYIRALSSVKTSSLSSIIEFQHSIMNALHENQIGTTIPVKVFANDPYTDTAIAASRKRPLNSIPSNNCATSTSTHKDIYIVLDELPVVSKAHSPTPLAVRLYVWLSGAPMSTIPYHRLSLHTMVHVGQQLGHIHHVFDKVFTTTSPIAMNDNTDVLLQQQQQQPERVPSLLPQLRYHQWDTKNTYDLLVYTQYIPNEQRRVMIESILHTFHTEILTKSHSPSSDSSGCDDNNRTPLTNGHSTATVATQFRTGIIMGDYNDANILLNHNTLQFNGVIDFGDSVER
jgi:hypothetical protein